MFSRETMRATWDAFILGAGAVIWVATLALAVALIADDTAVIGATMIVLTVALTLALKVSHKSWTTTLWAGAGVTLVLLYCLIGSIAII